MVLKMKRLSDDGWKRVYSNYRATITDFQRVVDYGRELSDKELEAEKTVLAEKAPGWTPIIARHEGKGVYSFFTTADSSD